ncbi:uncharacterized protein LOC117124760 [Anneissia japonica]|uniref:uncharacterized protein LOC117124760 n=1 Tax=Anneissia japonica TaxID=1529436 RepID=UPI0014259FAC|nr:uncharacterized protein LOC117124760 [Anneissia japonica]
MGRNGNLSITNDRVRFLFSVIIIFSLILLLVSFHSLQSTKTVNLSTVIQHQHVRMGHLRKANYSRSVGFLNIMKQKKLQRRLGKQKNITVDNAAQNKMLRHELKNQLVKNTSFSNSSTKVSTYFTNVRRQAEKEPVNLSIVKKELHSGPDIDHMIIQVNTSVEQVCRMPELKPFDPEIAHLFHDPSPLECKGQTISYVKNNHIFIRYEAVEKGKYESCQVSTIERDSDLLSFITDPIDVPVGPTHTRNDIELRYKIDSDFVIVGCENPEVNPDDQNPSSLEYETDFHSTHVDIHSHINPNKKVMAHARNTPLPKKALGLNVIMLGVDSTSRLNFIRKMPKSYRYLTEILGSVVLKGYNIVGDATNGALTPMLTGKHEKELPEVRKSFSNSTKVDVYPFVWKDFKKAGYATLFAEDSPAISAYNWRLNGFDAQPTDHYMRTFWQEVRVEGLCLGPKSVHEVMLDYMQDFMFDYKSIHHFGFMLYTGLTHADINQLSLLDEHLYSFLKKTNKDGLLNNTVLFVYSDHGARYTKIRATLQGKLEERLPFMSIFLPDWIRKMHPTIYKNLELNSNRLTTPFDIHATLRSILDYSSDVRDEVRRGMSLFHEVPLKRSCSMAGVAPHWCACLKWEMVPPGNDLEINTIAEVIVDELNHLVAPFSDHCAHIVLKKVKFAQRMIPNSEILTFDKTVDADQREPGFLKEANVDVHEMALLYQVTVETAPGPGLFEATLEMSHDKMNITRYRVTEEISRINLYGDQPKCIVDKYPKVAKFCFCKNQLNIGRDI